jgi:hypothetical protein
MDSSELRLAELGYRQELKRVLSHFGNFAVSFSLMSILSGVTGVPKNFVRIYFHGDLWTLHCTANCPSTDSLLEPLMSLTEHLQRAHAGSHLC